MTDSIGTEFARITFLADLRKESGQREGCPVCGSEAWIEDGSFGYCEDCGFDLVTEFSLTRTRNETSAPEPMTLNQAQVFYQGKQFDHDQQKGDPDA